MKPHTRFALTAGSHVFFCTTVVEVATASPHLFGPSKIECDSVVAIVLFAIGMAFPGIIVHLPLAFVSGTTTAVGAYFIERKRKRRRWSFSKMLAWIGLFTPLSMAYATAKHFAECQKAPLGLLTRNDELHDYTIGVLIQAHVAFVILGLLLVFAKNLPKMAERFREERAD